MDAVNKLYARWTWLINLICILGTPACLYFADARYLRRTDAEAARAEWAATRDAMLKVRDSDLRQIDLGTTRASDKIDELHRLLTPVMAQVSATNATVSEMSKRLEQMNGTLSMLNVSAIQHQSK